MSYSVKELYYTVQGEGCQAGRPAVFLRFAGCNLWTGHEKDREEAVCRFCDTDFVGTDGPGGGKFESAQTLAEAVGSNWPGGGSGFVVMTGGEPMLQVDNDLLQALHALDFEVAIETNGTLEVPDEVDWICVSPKAGAPLKQLSGDELKLVYPQENLHPSTFERLDYAHLLLQPMDGPHLEANTAGAIEYCLKNPRWRLSVQIHKVVGIR